MFGAHVATLCERVVAMSLCRLQTDYIDLYQLYRSDGITPIVETFCVLIGWVAEGKVRDVGCFKFAG